MLRTLGLGGKKVLILTDGVKPNVYMSSRNLSDTQVLNYPDVSTFHILWSEVVVIESSALGKDLSEKASDTDAEQPEAEAKSPAKSAKKSTRKSPTKTAGRKSAAKSTSAKSARKATAKAPKRAAKKKGK